MKYEGRLKTPIIARRVGLLVTDEQRQAAEKEQRDEMVAKLPDLFRAHGVEYGDWCALALSLAQEHVPGFKLAQPPGRKTEWNILDRAALKLDVDAIAADKGLPTTEAIKLACKQEPWAAKTKKMSLAAISKQYYLADEVSLKVVSMARAYESMTKGD